MPLPWVRNTPDDAYRFCKGEAVKKLVDGTTVQKKTAYDWCAVTDHAGYPGIMPLIIEKDNPMAKTPIGKEILSGDPKKGTDAFQQIMDSVLDFCHGRKEVGDLELFPTLAEAL